ncbi:uncharacterized protein LOC135833272 [Planococcus citri]|uniref:uncharacterized protein LOC135833272 n=1 Tax=Planococcus citri TaxID=170843 RepID=UPI0031F82DCD
MNSFLALLICANVAIMVSLVLGQELKVHDGEPLAFDDVTEKPKHWVTLRDEKFLQDCQDELNITRRYNIKALRVNWVPTKRTHVCLLDCYYFKLGKLYQKNNTEFVEYAFVDPPDFDFYQNETSAIMKKMYESINLCKQFLLNHRIERCTFMYQYRHCVDSHQRNRDDVELLGTRLG